MAGGARPGNQHARLGTMCRDAIRKAALSGDPKRITKVVARVFDEAEEGNMTAAQMIFERLDGKAPQPLTGGDGGDFVIQVIR